ncbi:MAG: DUF2958 domain-containing protein [Acidithiobacillus sp.]
MNEVSMMEAAKAMGKINQFIGAAQLKVMGDGCRGQEADYFKDKIVEMAGIIDAMPVSYETDGLGMDAVVQLHYFLGGWDWYITEKDVDTDGQGQIQAFGFADSGEGFGPELGYISIKEITRCGAELDLHWTPCTLRVIKDKAA